MNELSSFGDLLEAAKQQDEPHRLLFVFVQRHLGNQASPLQRESYAYGKGGHLRPTLCADKLPEDMTDFEALVQETEKMNKPWDLVFVSALSGHRGKSPTPEQVQGPLHDMVIAIEAGVMSHLVAFDREGHPVQFDGALGV